MKHVSSFFVFLVVLSIFCFPVAAIEPGLDDLPEQPTEADPSYVSIDPNSISDFVEALDDAWDARNSDDDLEPTVPVVVIDPESIAAISDSISDSLAADSEPLVVSAGSISGGYYFVCDCALGSGIKFWVPSDFKADAIALSDSGLVNMTNQSIYLMPDNPSFGNYTIYASRFGKFQYRRNSSEYDYQDLNIRNISDTNISFLSDTLRAVPDSTYWIVLIAICILGFLIIAFFKR